MTIVNVPPPVRLKIVSSNGFSTRIVQLSEHSIVPVKANFLVITSISGALIRHLPEIELPTRRKICLETYKLYCLIALKREQNSSPHTLQLRLYHKKICVQLYREMLPML